MPKQSAFARAVEILGGQTATALAIGGTVRQQSVSFWLVKKDGQIPPEHCIAIERATAAAGECVTRYELRPDVFGDSPPFRRRAANDDAACAAD